MIKAIKGFFRYIKKELKIANLRWELEQLEMAVTLGEIPLQKFIAHRKDILNEIKQLKQQYYSYEKD